MSGQAELGALCDERQADAAGVAWSVVADHASDLARRPPMWGLWLIDPSGKYGAHKPFMEHGESAEAALKSALARYRVQGATGDPTRKPFMSQGELFVVR